MIEFSSAALMPVWVVQCADAPQHNVLTWMVECSEPAIPLSLPQICHSPGVQRPISVALRSSPNHAAIDFRDMPSLGLDIVLV